MTPLVDKETAVEVADVDCAATVPTNAKNTRRRKVFFMVGLFFLQNSTHLLFSTMG
jgi:hypothetical protein